MAYKSSFRLRFMQFQVDIQAVQWHNVPGHQRVEAPKRCYVGKGCSCLLLARWELLIHGHTSTLPYIYNCMNVNSCPRSATIMAKGRTVTSSDSCDGSGCIPPPLERFAHSKIGVANSWVAWSRMTVLRVTASEAQGHGSRCMHQCISSSSVS